MKQNYSQLHLKLVFPLFSISYFLVLKTGSPEVMLPVIQSHLCIFPIPQV